MRFRTLIVWVLAAAFVAALPFLWTLVPSAATALGNGTDEKAKNAIHEAAPAYRPWFDSFWRPSNPATERMLFTAQALAGTLAFIGVVRTLREKGRRKK